MTEQIRVLIVDDHPLFRFGIKTRLGTESDIVVIGEATSAGEALALTATLVPDVVLMDLNLPDMSGIEATTTIAATHPDMSILVITMFDDDSVFSAMRAGARGYLLKGADGDEIVRAIRAVHHKEAIFSPSIAQRLIHFFETPRPEASHLFPELTLREREILKLLAQGYTNQAIAARLVLSAKTVRNYVSNIFGKLQVASRAEAIVRARESGFV